MIFEPKCREAPIVLRTLRIATFATAVACVPATVLAETTLWGKVGKWSVSMDRSMLRGCSIHRSFEDDTSIILGFLPLPEGQGVYFTVTNTNWKPLKAGKTLDVRVQFGSSPPIDAKADVLEASHAWFIVVPQRIKLFEKFEKNEVLHIKPRGRNTASFKLDRASDALAEMRECQRMITEDNKISPEVRSDPFAKTPSAITEEDPFAKPSFETSRDDPFAKPPASSASDDPFAKKP